MSHVFQAFPLSFHDDHGNVCYASIDRDGVASVTVTPLLVDAVIDEHIRIAIDLGREVYLCHDRHRARVLEREQEWRMDMAADLQSEWSFSVTLPPVVTAHLWDNEQVLKDALSGTTDEAAHAILEEVHAQIRTAIEQSPLHPSNSSVAA